MSCVFIDLEDGSLSVLVDGDDDLAVLHTGEMLNGARDTNSDVEFGCDDLAGLPDLHVVGDHAGVHRGPAGSHGRPQLVGEVVQHPEVVPGLHPTPAADDDLGAAQVGPVGLAQLLTDKLGAGGKVSGSRSVLDSTRAASSGSLEGR